MEIPLQLIFLVQLLKKWPPALLRVVFDNYVNLSELVTFLKNEIQKYLYMLWQLSEILELREVGVLCIYEIKTVLWDHCLGWCSEMYPVICNCFS